MAEKNIENTELPGETTPVEQPGDNTGSPDTTLTETATDDIPSGEVTPEGTPPAEEAVAKHKYADRLAKAYPGREFKSDEEHEAGMEEHMTELEGYMEKGKSSNSKLIAMFEAEPQIGEIVRDCINGSSFREALARHVSPEDLTAIEGDPDYEGWNKNKTERESKVAEKNKFQEDYEKNIGTSEQAITAYVEKQGLTEEQADAFFQKFDDMLDNVNKGIITEQHLEAWMKALNYDTDVIVATEQGKIAGRNEKIVATKETAKKEGDGMPRPNNASQEPEPEKQVPNYMDELVRKTKSRDVFA